MGCKERDLRVQALYWWKLRKVKRVPQAKRDAARSHVLSSLTSLRACSLAKRGCTLVT